MLVAISFLAILAYMCSPRAPKTVGELCGTYVLDCELTAEELVLRPDGTFTQTITIKSTSERISSKGKWTYRTHTTRGQRFGDVTLDGFCAVLKWPDELYPDYSHAHPGISVLPAQYWFGRLTLGGVDSWPAWKRVK